MTALIVFTFVLGAPVPKTPEKPEAKFDGVWVLTARESGGRVMKTSDALKESYTLIIVGNDYHFRNHAGTIKFDKDKKTFDLAVTGGLYKGENSGGVFQRDGETLKLAMPTIPRTATARPTELASAPGTSHTLYTFERNKDASEKAADKLKEKVTALPVRANPQLIPAVPLPAPLPVAPRPNAAQQLQEALERIEKLEKRVQELEKLKGIEPKKDEPKKDSK